MSRIAGNLPTQPQSTSPSSPSTPAVVTPPAAQRVAGGGLPMKPSEYLAQLRKLNPGVGEDVLRAQVHEWMKQMMPANQG